LVLNTQAGFWLWPALFFFFGLPGLGVPSASLAIGRAIIRMDINLADDLILYGRILFVRIGNISGPFRLPGTGRAPLWAALMMEIGGCGGGHFRASAKKDFDEWPNPRRRMSPQSARNPGTELFALPLANVRCVA